MLFSNDQNTSAAFDSDVDVVQIAHMMIVYWRLLRRRGCSEKNQTIATVYTRSSVAWKVIVSMHQKILRVRTVLPSTSPHYLVAPVHQISLPSSPRLHFRDRRHHAASSILRCALFPLLIYPILEDDRQKSTAAPICAQGTQVRGGRSSAALERG